MIGLSGSKTGTSAVVSSSGFSGFLDADVWESVLVAVLRGVLRGVLESKSTTVCSAGFLDAGFSESVLGDVLGSGLGGDLGFGLRNFFGGVERYMQQNSYPIPCCHCASCLVACLTGSSAGDSASWKKGGKCPSRVPALLFEPH